jgi:hypothetical protein
MLKSDNLKKLRKKIITKPAHVALLLNVFLIMAVSSLHASEEQIHFPTEITITANAGEIFGEVTAEIKTNKESKSPKIKSIRLNIDDEWKLVPEKAFADLENVLLQKTEIRTEKGYDESPWLYIYFEISHRTESGSYFPKRVHIAYRKDKFESRFIDTPMSQHESKTERIDLS